jgi:hypothetical protein
MMLECCYIDPVTKYGCIDGADFEVTDLADRTETAVTHACEDHVGALLGHHESLPDDAENRWEVRALTFEEKT